MHAQYDVDDNCKIHVVKIFQLFEYERVVQILLNGVADVNQEGFVQRIAIYLLNSLACQVDGKQKRFLGNHGAIGVSIVYIDEQLC